MEKKSKLKEMKKKILTIESRVSHDLNEIKVDYANKLGYYINIIIDK